MTEFKFQQSVLGNIITGATTNVDLVFVIDATQSMAPVIETVKNLALTFHEELRDSLEKYHRSINQLRVKVIAFRDYYCDDRMALQESEFFYLPEESHKFKSFVSRIQAKGGGDIPESALEALAVAMRSEWVQEGTSKRHAIVLFTDAPPHPLEQQKNGIPDNYPDNMFKNLNEMKEAWGIGQGSCVEGVDNFKMDKRARRLVLFAPEIPEWKKVSNFEQCFFTPLTPDNGGKDLSMNTVIDSVAKSLN